MTTSFESSDAIRTTRPLRYAQNVEFERTLQLEHGGTLPRVHVCYETYGTLTAAKDNAVLICHALSGDSHVARHDPEDDPGWWDLLVGPGKPIDTDRFFVICPNNLGSCRGTSGPSDLNTTTGQPYGGDFPLITTGDIVEVQRMLIDHLGIDKLLAVIGGSMGGQQVLLWGTRFPDRVAGAVAIATSAGLTNQALAFDIVGRNAILRDPKFANGQYYQNGGPSVGLAVARMLAHITYLSPQSMAQKFEPDRLQPRELQTNFENKFSVGSYLAYQGHRFVERFDANSYISLTMAMDLFDLGREPEILERNLGQSRCRWLVMSFSTDWLFPPFQSEQIVHALLRSHRPVTYAMIESTCGHDAFLLKDDVDRYGELIRYFLRHLPEGVEPKPEDALSTPAEHDAARGGRGGGLAPTAPTSIFHNARLDYLTMTSLIPPDSSVLDLGCGQGALLSLLRERGHRRLMGVELDEQAIVHCARQGLDVIRADLNQGMVGFGDNFFDVVVLSQTLQTVRDVPRLLTDMLRVGRLGIVSFPNFAFGPLRRHLMEQGRAPRAKLLGHQWYNSPNIRFLSIADFQDYCREYSIRIHRMVALDTERGMEVAAENDPNLNADTAIFVVSR